ncbi:DUF86 domain-containing protein [Aneurinibacillus soli]|nr:HepT-like ribonuclease domain-containing protein [Aneurinibacillus soli]
MYQVNTEKIEQHLVYMEQVLESVSPILRNSEANDMLTSLSLQRALHIALETVADVGNYLIDGFIMRDPGSYEDIVEIMLDETVITAEIAVALKEVVNMRKPLITDYLDVRDDAVSKLLNTHYAKLVAFPNQVREYLKKEL